jgi:hypothetical protein
MNQQFNVIHTSLSRVYITYYDQQPVAHVHLGLLLWFKYTMPCQKLRNHKMTHILVCPVRKVARYTSQE